MRKRMAGIAPDQIPDAEQREVMDLLWEAPEVAIMTIGPVQRHPWREPEEIVRFGSAPKCHELVAEPYLRLLDGEPVWLIDRTIALPVLTFIDIHGMVTSKSIDITGEPPCASFARCSATSPAGWSSVTAARAFATAVAALTGSANKPRSAR